MECRTEEPGKGEYQMMKLGVTGIINYELLIISWRCICGEGIEDE
jgi:hypothetical protein